MYAVASRISNKEDETYKMIEEVWGRHVMENKIKIKEVGIAVVRKEVEKQRSKLREECSVLRSKRDELSSCTIEVIDLIYCVHCGANFVEKHIGDLDKKGTNVHNAVICDSCKDNAKPTKTDKLVAPLKCYNEDCGEVIHWHVHEEQFYSEFYPRLAKAKKRKQKKYAQSKGGVVASQKIVHKQHLDVQYGRVDLLIECGLCGTQNKYVVDYGWKE